VNEPVFAVIDKLAKIMIIHKDSVAKHFDPEVTLDLECQEVIPLAGAEVGTRNDLDNIKKRQFYFTISRVPGKRKPFYIFSCQTSQEREKWVERIRFMSNLAVDMDVLQTHADMLQRKLFSATTLLKMNVGEVLLGNMLNGTYKKGSRKYREVKGHLDGYFEIWEDVMGKKIQVHNQILSFVENSSWARTQGLESSSTNLSYSDEDPCTPKNKLLNRVVRTIKHVRKDSINSAALEDQDGMPLSPLSPFMR